MIDDLQYHSSLGAGDHLVLLYLMGDYEAMRKVLLELAWDFDHLESIDDIWNFLILDYYRLCTSVSAFTFL